MIGDLTASAEGLFRSRARLVRIQARYTPMLQTIPALSQVLVLVLGGWLVINDRITLGTFLAFASYLVQLVAPSRMLAGLLAVGQQARAGGERVLELLDSTSEVDRPAGRRAARRRARRGQLRRRHLRLPALRAGAGRTSRCTSPPASGWRWWARPARASRPSRCCCPASTTCRRGGSRSTAMDVRDVTLESLRRSVGVVFEESFLFSDTVRSNIAYGRPDASADDVERAARAAAAHDFILELPDGYDTVVGERGLTLSGGQRQRIALARTLLTDPRVLVLDDATSAVDATTEEEIQSSLSTLLEGRTTLLIAHRRSTLRLADRIVVVDGGRLVAEGTHEELLGSSPLYRALLAGPDDAIRRGAGGRRPGLGRGDHLGLAGPRPAGGAGTSPGGQRPGGPGGTRARRRRHGAQRHARAARPARAAAPGRRRPPGRPRGRGSRRRHRPVPAGQLPPAVPGAARHRPRARHVRRHPHPGRTAPRPQRRRRGHPGRVVRLRARGRGGVHGRRAPRLARDVGLDPPDRADRRAAAARAPRADLLPPPAAVGRLLRPRARRPGHDPDDDRRRGPEHAPPDRSDPGGRQLLHLRRRADRARCRQLAAHVGGDGRGPAAVRGDVGLPRPLGPRPTTGRGSASPRSTPTSRRTSPGCGWRRRRPASSVNSAGFRRLSGDYLDARLDAQRLVALYFPFVHFLSTVARGRRARGGEPDGVGRDAHRRRAHRLHPLPRPVLLAGPAALAGVRHLPAGGRVDAAHQRADGDADLHARRRPSRSRCPRTSPGGSGSRTCTSRYPGAQRRGPAGHRPRDPPG